MSITNLNFYRDLLATRGCFEGTNVDQLVVRRPALGTNLLICNTVNNTVNINGTLNVSGGISVSGLTTDGITEGSTNLYYTNARARAAISVSDSLANLGYSSSTGVISLVSSPTFNSLRLTTGASNGLYLRSDASGNASWNALPASVSSLTGTADQVLVAGTSGIPQTGVITLTLPQSINTSSSPTFASLTATNSVFATTLFGRNTAVNANDTLYLGSSVANQQFYLDRPNTGGAVNIGYMTTKSSTFNPIFNVYNNATDKTQCFSVYSVGTTNGQNSVYCGVNLGLSTTTPTQALEISGVNRQIYLNSSTSNFVRFNSQGSAAPTISGARSAGSKVILADLFSSGTSSDHSIGVDTGTVWYNTALNTHQHKWYLGASQMMALSTTGLSVGSSVITEMFSCGSANQFRVNSSGQVVAGSWNAGIIGLQFGGVGVSLAGTGSTGAVLRQNSLGANITVSQLAASDLSNGVSGSGSIVLSQSPTITGNLSVNGNLLITGETINSIANDVRFGDRYLFVNATYTTNTGLETGMIFNYLPTNTTSALASSFVAGVNGVSNPRVNTVASGLFAAGDLVLITDSTSNDGIFEVDSNVGTLLVVRGVGLTAPTFSFTSTQFVAEASTGNVRRIGATVLRCDTTGNLGVASGNTTTGMSFANLLRSGGALGTPSSGNLSSCSNYPTSALTGSINLATQVSGLLGVANAGLGVSLAGTGSAGAVLRQNSLGASITVSQLSAADLSNGVSGSGSVVLATSPVLSSPALGTPTSGNLSSCTNYPASALSGSISLTSQVSGILPIANAGLGVSLAGTGSTGAVLRQNSLGANITVSQLSAADLSNGVSGSGNVVLANSPTLITPALGVVSSGNLAACTNYPASALSGSVSLTSQVSGLLPLSNGGSNANLSPIAGGVVFSDASKFDITAAGSAGQVLVSNGSSAPSWANLSGIGVSSITGTANQITASASTGPITLSLPNTLNLGENQYTKTVIRNNSTLTSTKNNILISPNSYAFIPCSGSNNVAVIQNVLTDSPSVMTSIAVQNFPLACRVHPNNNTVFVSNYNSNTVSVIQSACTNSPSVLTAITVGTQPIGVCFTPNGLFAYVSNGGSANCSVINTQTNAVITTIALQTGPYVGTATRNGSRVFIPNLNSATVSVIQNASTNPSLLANVAVGTFPTQVVLHTLNVNGYVCNATTGSISVLNNILTGTPTVITTLTGLTNINGLCVSPDGRYLYGAGNGNVWSFSLTNPALPSLITTIAITNATYLDITGDGRYLYVSCRTTLGTSLSVLQNADTGSPTVLTTLITGQNQGYPSVGNNGLIENNDVITLSGRVGINDFNDVSADLSVNGVANIKGNLVMGSEALAVNSTNGFLYTTTTPGRPTGVPSPYTGRVAQVYDTTNNSAFIYNGAWLAIVPTGVVLPFVSTTIPTGWLICEGQAVSRTTFAALYAVIGNAYGRGDNATTFNVPDMRGNFMRGRANGSANDPDRAARTATNSGNAGDNVGSNQASMFASHTHTNRTGFGRWGDGNDWANGGSSWGVNSLQVTEATGAAGGNETRPINLYFVFIIKT